MYSLSATASIIAVLQLVAAGYQTTISIFQSAFFFSKYYGIAGPILWLFGDRDVWRIQVQVLQSTNELDAMEFKKLTQDDSNIIAVAGTIVAQIAITALSLTDLSNTHWVARASFTFSLVSAIMAVYYATRQYRTLGRCLRADDVKVWIRPTETTLSHYPERALQQFLPSAASVLTVSAPNMLLSASLNAFLVGLGVYLGYVWTRNLDQSAGSNASRAVFIVYVVGLALCYGIYALSDLAAESSHVSEWDVLHGSHSSAARAPGQPSTHSSNLDPEAVTEDYRPSSKTEKQPQQTKDPDDDSTRQELVRTLREAADLRRKSAIADEKVAGLLERLDQFPVLAKHDMRIREEERRADD